MVKPEYLRGDLPRTRDAYESLLHIAIPAVIEMVFMSLIGSVDVIMVGRLGYEAIAAVGLAGQPRLIVLSFFMALNVGVTAIVARRKGQDIASEANRTVRNALVLITGLTVVLTAFALIFSRQIMLIAGAQNDTLAAANDYFRIMIYFLPVNTLTMCINAAQRGIGNTRTPMIANLAANLVNVVFDYLLIGGHLGFPKLGVAGAAWASGIGFCVCMGITFIGLFSHKGNDPFLYISFQDDWHLHKATVQSIFRIGGSSIIEQIAQRAGLFVYAIVIANLGTAVFAAHQVGMQFLSFSFNFGTGLSIASTSLVGQVLGRNRPDLAVVYGKCSQRLSLLVSLVLAVSIVIFRRPLISIFLDRHDPANLLSFRIAMDLMLMVALFQPPQMSSVVISGCLRGAGDNLFVAVVMIICVAVLRPALSLVAVHVFGLGVIGAWGASLVDMCLRLSLAYYRFSGSKWHDKRV